MQVYIAIIMPMRQTITTALETLKDWAALRLVSSGIPICDEVVVEMTLDELMLAAMVDELMLAAAVKNRELLDKR